MRGRSFLAGVAVSLMLYGAAAGAEEPSRAAGKEHLLVHVVKQSTGFKVVESTLVNTALPKRRDLDRTYPWRLRVLTRDGKVVYQVGLRDPAEVRGEFQNPNDPDRIDSVHFKKKEAVHFTIRLPIVAASSIEFHALRPDVARSSHPPDEDFEKLGSVPYPEVKR